MSANTEAFAKLLSEFARRCVYGDVANRLSTATQIEEAFAALEAERDALQRKLQEQALAYLTRDGECIGLLAERDALRAALADAAQSLETIAKNAGKRLDSEGQENMLAHHDQVRGYANGRAGAARAAMKGTQ